LKHFYEQATVIFIGKSLTAEGGKTRSSRVPWAKPWFLARTCRICRSGPRLIQQDAAVQVSDAAELEKALGDLLSDETRREQLGRNALEVVHKNLGAIIARPT